MKNLIPQSGKKAFGIGAIALISIAMLVQSCVKDSFDFGKLAQTDWNPEFAAPLVYSSLSLKNILAENDSDGFIKEDGTKFLTLVYTGNIISATGEEFLPILNQYKGHTHELSSGEISTLLTADVTVSGSTEIEFAVQNTEQLDSMILKGGLFTAFLSSTYKNNFDITYNVPALTKNGVPFTKTISVTASGTTSSTVNESVNDITGYRLDLTQSTPKGRVPVFYQIRFKQSTTPALATQKVSFSFQLTSLRFTEVYGYLGEMVVPVKEDSSRVKIYNNVITGKLHFADPKILFTIRNSFGLPIQAKFNMLKAFNDNAEKNITGFPNPLMLNAPSSIQQGLATTTILIDTTGINNILEVIEMAPKYISYDFVATANPAGSPPVNFLSDKSQFIVDIDVELPLNGRAETIVFQDIVDFALQSFDEIQSGDFVINMTNTFPIEAGLQLYLVDDKFNIMDSLVPANEKIIAGGIVNASGKVTSPSKKSTVINLTAERLKKMSSYNNKLIVRGTVATTGAGSTNVKLYSDYILDVQLAAKAKLNKKI